MAEIYSQGRTLVTPQTRRWTREEVLANDAIEARFIFKHFSSEDQGRSRVKVAEFFGPDAATLCAEAVEALNAMGRKDG